MQDDKISNPLVFVDCDPIEFLRHDRRAGSLREKIEQVRQASLDQMDAGGFEGFEEAGGQPQGDAVLIPEFLAPPGGEAQKTRLGARRTIKIGEQRRRGLIVADKAAAIHIAVADPVLQRNAPLPARRPRRGAGERGQHTGALARHGHRPVARQPAGPVLVPGLKCPLDQQAAKPRAVDEKIRLDALSVIQLQRADESVLAAQLLLHDLALHAHHASCQCIAAQVLRVKTGIEVKGMRKYGRQVLIARAAGANPPEARGDGVERIFLETARLAEPPKFEPVLMQRYLLETRSVGAEWMEIIAADPRPIFEFNTQFDRAPGPAKKFLFVDAECLIEHPDRGNGRLADADDADVWRLDHPNVAECAPKTARQYRSGHPTRRTAAQDGDASDVHRPARGAAGQ